MAEQSKAELKYYDICGKYATNTKVNRHTNTPQDTINAARDTVKKVNNCINEAQDQDGQDRLVSVTDLAWSKAKGAWLRYVEKDGHSAKAADKEFDNNWKHYGVSDALFDGATLVLGGGIGSFVGRGVVGALGRAAAKQVAGKTLGAAAHVLEGAAKVAQVIGTEQKASHVAKAVKSATQHADELVAQGKHTESVLKHGSAKGQAALSRKADKIAQEIEPQQQIVEVLKKKGHSNSAKVIETKEKIRQSTAKMDNILVQKEAAHTQRASVLNTLSPKVKSGSVLGGAAVGLLARNMVIAPQRQEGSKNSSDVRIEMDTIAEHLQARNKPVTAQVLLDVHTALKKQNLDKGEPDKNGLDKREINALPKIFDKLDI